MIHGEFTSEEVGVMLHSIFINPPSVLGAKIGELIKSTEKDNSGLTSLSFYYKEAREIISYLHRCGVTEKSKPARRLRDLLKEEVRTVTASNKHYNKYKTYRKPRAFNF